MSTDSINNKTNDKKENEIQTNLTKESTTPISDLNKQDNDLKKAIAFLLSKEMKEYSLEKKKEFLLKKLPQEIVDKAISLYPLIESNINSQIQEYKSVSDDKKESLLHNFFNLGVLSSVLLTTLGINYLIDLNRNKKNDLFYKECEKKINEELNKNTKELKEAISNEMVEYVSKESLKDKVNSQLIEFTQQRGLNLNLSSKTVKEDLAKLKIENESKDKMIKELNVKIENNKILLKEEILKDTRNLIEDSSNKLLNKFIENQDNFLKMLTNAINTGKTNDTAGILNMNMNKQNLISEENINTNLNNISKIQSINDVNLILNDDNLDLNQILESVINSIKEDKDRSPMIKQLKNQFSAISETFKKDTNKENLPFINITNRTYKNCSNLLLTQLLKKVGFKNESGSIFKFDGTLDDLNSAINIIEEYDKN